MLCAQGELLGLCLLQMCDAPTLQATYTELLRRHSPHDANSSSSDGASGSSDEDGAAPPGGAPPAAKAKSPKRRLPNTDQPQRHYSRPWAVAARNVTGGAAVAVGAAGALEREARGRLTQAALARALAAPVAPALHRSSSTVAVWSTSSGGR